MISVRTTLSSASRALETIFTVSSLSALCFHVLLRGLGTLKHGALRRHLLWYHINLRDISHCFLIAIMSSLLSVLLGFGSLSGISLLAAILASLVSTSRQLAMSFRDVLIASRQRSLF